MRLLVGILLLAASSAQSEPLAEAVRALGPGAVRVVGVARPRQARQLERELAGAGPTRVTVNLTLEGQRVRAELVAVQPRFDLLRPGRWWRREVVAWPLDARWSRLLGAPVARTLGKPRSIGVDVGAPVLAVAIADLDGDGRGELHVATADALFTLGAERKRRELLGEPAVPRSRVPVATIVVTDADEDGKDELLVASSARGVFTRIDEQQVTAGGPVWPLCQGLHGRLVPGTPLLAVAGQPAELQAFACSRLAQVAVAADGHFWLTDGAGERSGEGAGSAVALIDAERDGRAELLASAATSPGAGDVLSLDGRPLSTTSGTIVAVAVGDRNGDGLDDLAWIVRTGGKTSLWTLE